MIDLLVDGVKWPKQSNHFFVLKEKKFTNKHGKDHEVEKHVKTVIGNAL